MSPTEIYEQQLEACDMARERGARVVALAMPDFLRMRANTILNAIPEFRRLMRTDEAARRAAVADPDDPGRAARGARGRGERRVRRPWPPST